MILNKSYLILVNSSGDELGKHNIGSLIWGSEYAQKHIFIGDYELKFRYKRNELTKIEEVV